MAEQPYILIEQAVLTGNGTGTVSYTVSNQERLRIYEIFQQATGAFNITDIRDSTGNHFTNASANVEIPSILIASGANGYNHLGKFPIPIELAGGVTIYIDLEDTSGSGNTIDIIAMCVQDYP